VAERYAAVSKTVSKDYGGSNPSAPAMNNEEMTPGWVVYCETLAQWEIIHNKGQKNEWIETKTRKGSQILYSGQDVERANSVYEFYETRNSFVSICIEEVENLPMWGTGRFL
jgi:hypothetical protein